MNRVLILFFITLLSIATYAQDKGLELEQAFYTATSDSLKMQAFERLFYHYVVRDYDKTKEILPVMDSLCQEMNNDMCFGSLLLFQGLYHRMTASFDSSLYYLKLANDVFGSIGNSGKQAICLFNTGVVSTYKGNYEAAVLNYLEAKEMYSQAGNNNGIVNVANSLGIVYKDLHEYSKAKKSYLDGLKLALDDNNENMEAMIYNNIANLYYAMETEPDSTIYYGQKALELETKLERNTGIASAHNLISVGYMDQGETEKSLYHGIEAVRYSELSDNHRFRAIHTIALADIYKKLNRPREAEKAYKKGLAIADSISLISHQVHGYREYAELLFDQGNYQAAYNNRIKYETFKDSIDVENSRSEIAELEKKYDIALKDKELKDKELQIANRTNQRNIFLSGFLLTFLVGGSLIWGIVSRLRRNKKIAFQEKNMQLQRIQSLEQEKKLLSMTSLLEGQESERIRIAKELHDGLGGLLTTVKAHFGKIQDALKKIEDLDIYKNASLMIDKAHDEVRRISHNLMPADLRVGGLELAIKQLVHEMKNIHEIKTELELVGMEGVRIDENTELLMYRIIQELLNNIVKYSEAENVLIQISKFEEEINLVVEDDGVGFNYQEALLKDGIGLKSIISRVEQAGGDLDVKSDNDGTSVSINIPFALSK